MHYLTDCPMVGQTCSEWASRIPKAKQKKETECSMTADVHTQVHLAQVRKNIYLPGIKSPRVSLNSWKSNSGPSWKQGPWQG